MLTWNRCTFSFCRFCRLICRLCTLLQCVILYECVYFLELCVTQSYRAGTYAENCFYRSSVWLVKSIFTPYVKIVAKKVDLLHLLYDCTFPWFASTWKTHKEESIIYFELYHRGEKNADWQISFFNKKKVFSNYSFLNTVQWSLTIVMHF